MMRIFNVKKLIEWIISFFLCVKNNGNFIKEKIEQTIQQQAANTAQNYSRLENKGKFIPEYDRP